MGRYSLEENWEILKTFFQSDESSTQTVRNLAKKNGQTKTAILGQHLVPAGRRYVPYSKRYTQSFTPYLRKSHNQQKR